MIAMSFTDCCVGLKTPAGASGPDWKADCEDGAHCAAAVGALLREVTLAAAPAAATRGGQRLVRIDARENRDQVVAIWKILCGCCRHSYYTSPGWIENWLACVKDGFRPWLLLLLEGEAPVAAFLAVCSKRLRGGLVPSRVVSVYGTGDYKADGITPIYNAFLTPGDVRVSLARLLKMLPFAWDEFCLPGLSPDDFPGTHLDACNPGWLLRDYDKPLYYVEMDKFDRERESYLNLLSANSRSQIRRSFRLYAQNGPVRIREAATVEEALEMAEALYALCHLRKSKQHRRCSIDSFFRKFHDRLLRNRFSRKETQLLHIFNDAGTIGYLYNHVYDGVVYSYQSGFVYTKDNRLKPGLVAHVEAIVHNAALGHIRYDFGAGIERYKKTLATGSNSMQWVRILRPSLKMGFFKFLKGVNERLRVAWSPA